MNRIVLTYLLPFLAPTVLYFAWAWFRARYVTTHGGEAPKIERGPWVTLLVLGAVLTLITLTVTALTRGSGADSVYTPSRLENGRLVPGQMDAKPK